MDGSYLRRDLRMMRRFFVHPEDVHAPRLRLTGAEAAHVIRVLRMGPGAQISAFDGSGREYVAVLERLEPEGVLCHIVQELDARPMTAVRISLGQGLPKADKFEWVIQKTTELGVTEIVPLATERVVPQIPAGRMAAKQARWEKIAREACKQCGRATVPRVRPPTPLEAFFSSCQDTDLKIVLWEGEQARHLRTILAVGDRPASIALVIGPEGGLTPWEVAQGESYGFLPAGLGGRILRTETASLVAVTLLQYRFGDLG
jgi:16S rRNA (uracil1498-N3)-methyltransferase